MKKVMLLLTTLLIGGMMLSSCKKDNPTPTPTPTPEPTPTPTTYTVSYEVLNIAISDTMSDCFKIDVTYIDADGQSVTLTNQALPWIKSFEVEAPFHAEMSGAYTYKEEELPDTLYFGKCHGITISNATYYDGGGAGTIQAYTKAKFLEIYGNPEKLKFTNSKDVK